MLKWPRQTTLPNPRLVYDLALKVCGDDTRCHSVANSVVALICYELYIPSEYQAATFAKTAGLSPTPMRLSYANTGDRPYVRALACLVVQELADNAGLGPRMVSPGKPDYASITREVLTGHAGIAVLAPAKGGE